MPVKSRPFLVSLLLLLIAIILSVAIGSVYIPPQEVIEKLWSGITGISRGGTPDAFSAIILDIRLPRTLLIAIAGAALAGSGSAYQGLFRNPLADPYLIGVASGAGLGAVLAMSIQWPYNFLGLLAIPLAAFAGALTTTFIVYQLAHIGKTVPTTNLLLAGVAVSAFASAITSFLMLRSTGELRRAIVWLLGGASQAGWQPLLALLPYACVCLAILPTMGHAINIMQFGDEQAKQLGLHVEKARRQIIIIATLTSACAVAFTGIIGFVGLIVPHVVRLICGSDYRRLIPLSIINGSVLLLLSDTLARIIIPPQEVPVGIITALAGGPFFLWILRRVKEQNYW